MSWLIHPFFYQIHCGFWIPGGHIRAVLHRFTSKLARNVLNLCTIGCSGYRDRDLDPDLEGLAGILYGQCWWQSWYWGWSQYLNQAC